MTQVDRNLVRTYYDEYGNAEWERLEEDIKGRVSLEVHRKFLARFINQGDRILEIGAGPGRFTRELIDRGARVAVTDFSPVQLDLNRMRLADSTSVESWEILDVCDTTRYVDGEFDAVVAYGGPLSYAFENVDQALTGLFRIVRPGGVVVASVMSLLGTWKYFLAETIIVAETFGEDTNDAILRTGDLRHIGGANICQMFRASDITALVERCGGEVLAMSASNWASLDKPEVLTPLESDPLSVRIATTVIAQKKFLTDLESIPNENMATLRTVTQSKRYRLWRVSHPYEKDIAVRLIVWFPPDNDAVVVVALAANKAPIGDIFYDGVANRADAAIDRWLQETEESE